MKKIKQVIVVEGKDDTAQIKKAVNADTIETRGSAISPATLKLIKRLDKERGIIIFTDPDYSGERIRKIVERAAPDAKNAFVPRKLAVPKRNHGSLGVEHTAPDVIRKVLSKAYPSRINAKSRISKATLIDAGLVGSPAAKIRRQRLCNVLNIGYVNGKQLSKRLGMFGITPEQFDSAVKKVNEED